MSKKTKNLVGIAVLVVLIVVAVFVYNRVSTQTTLELADDEAMNMEESENIPATDFTAYDNDGNEVKLSDYLGKPIVLNFWASWCPPCKSEMPHFNTVYEEMKGDVVFLMVDMVDGQQETVADGKKYIADNNFTFPVLFDTNQEGAYTYGIRSIPTTLFIDKNGNIVTWIAGAMDEETLRNGVGLIMKEDIEMKEDVVMQKAEYHKISPEEARKMLDENSSAILLDVRTDEEFNTQHIDGAVLIPDYELEARADKELPDKNALILIYCRSGNRSKTAANLLVSMGYTNVYDFGGITSYPYETVSN